MLSETGVNKTRGCWLYNRVGTVLVKCVLRLVKPHIVTSAHVSIKVPSRLHVRWSWKNAHGIRAVNDYEKLWFWMQLWVPKGKGTNSQAQAQRKVEAKPPPNKGLTKWPVALEHAPRVGKDRQAIKGCCQAQAKDGSLQVILVSAS